MTEMMVTGGTITMQRKLQSKHHHHRFAHAKLSWGSSNCVFHHQRLLITFGEGCRASRQPSYASAPIADLMDSKNQSQTIGRKTQASCVVTRFSLKLSSKLQCHDMNIATECTISKQWREMKQ